MLHFLGDRKAISEEAYLETEEFYSDVAKAYQNELRFLAERGANCVQLDDKNLAYLCDPKMREGARQRGEDPDTLPRRYAQLINAAVADCPAVFASGCIFVEETSRVHGLQREDTNRSKRFCSMSWM